jgi:hypothetical protein
VVGGFSQRYTTWLVKVSAGNVKNSVARRLKASKIGKRQVGPGDRLGDFRRPTLNTAAVWCNDLR